MGFAVPEDQWVKIKESKRIDKYLDLTRELKKLWNMKVTVISVVVGGKVLEKKSGGIGNQRKTQEHPNHSIAKIG